MKMRTLSTTLPGDHGIANYLAYTLHTSCSLEYAGTAVKDPLNRCVSVKVISEDPEESLNTAFSVMFEQVQKCQTDFSEKYGTEMKT